MHCPQWRSFAARHGGLFTVIAVSLAVDLVIKCVFVFNLMQFLPFTLIQGRFYYWINSVVVSHLFFGGSYLICPHFVNLSLIFIFFPIQLLLLTDQHGYSHWIKCITNTSTLFLLQRNPFYHHNNFKQFLHIHVNNNNNNNSKENDDTSQRPNLFEVMLWTMWGRSFHGLARHWFLICRKTIRTTTTHKEIY